MTEISDQEVAVVRLKLKLTDIAWLRWVESDQSQDPPTVPGEFDRMPQARLHKFGLIAFDECDLDFWNPYLTPLGKKVFASLTTH
jgi:hypothetical protein